jgi:transcriptional regulator with XRE-family HTH domain
MDWVRPGRDNLENLVSHAMSDDALRCALENLATRLLEARMQHGMSRRELARQMGYANLDVGCARIADWECGQTEPKSEQVQGLADALELGNEHLHDWVEEIHHERTQLTRRRRLLATMIDSASRRDQTLVALHYAELVEHLSQIIAWPSWRDIRVGASKVELTFTGGFTPTLGMYLANWREDNFTVAPTMQKSRYYVLEVTGSPLSNMHALTGFEASKPQITYGRRHDRATLLEFVAPLFQTRRLWAEPSPTPWTVGQLLTRLGAYVEDICLVDLEGTSIGSYSHKSASIWLSFRGRTFEMTYVDALKSDGSWPSQATWSWPMKPADALRDEEIGVALKREALILETTKGPCWSAYPGVLLNADGDPVILFDGILPVPVLESLANWFSELDISTVHSPPSQPLGL